MGKVETFLRKVLVFLEKIERLAMGFLRRLWVVVRGGIDG